MLAITPITPITPSPPSPPSLQYSLQFSSLWTLYSGLSREHHHRARGLLWAAAFHVTGLHSLNAQTSLCYTHAWHIFMHSSTYTYSGYRSILTLLANAVRTRKTQIPSCISFHLGEAYNKNWSSCLQHTCEL